MTPDAERLRQIRSRLDNLDGERWSRGYMGEQRLIVADGGPMNGRAEILEATKLCTDDEFDFASDAIAMVRFLIALLDRAKARIIELQDELRELKAKNYAAQAAIKLTEKPFQDFLARLPELSGISVPDDPVAAADARLKALLGIQSKKDLNRSDKAADRWRGLMREFAHALQLQGVSP